MVKIAVHYLVQCNNFKNIVKIKSIRKFKKIIQINKKKIHTKS